LTIAALDAVLDVEHAVARRVMRLAHGRVELLAIVGVDLRFEYPQAGLYGRRCIVDGSELIRPVQAISEVIVVEYADADEPRRKIELCLAPYQLLLGLLARSSVEAGADEMRRRPLGSIQK